MKKSSKSKGRLVWNHSTHMKGLIPILDKLTQYEGIETITPGVIGSSRSHIPHIKLKISVPICGGFKLIARQGTTVQEVFMLTRLTQEDLEEVIAQVLAK